MNQLSYEINPQLKSELMKCQNIVMLGQIAANRPLYPRSGLWNEPITPMRQGNNILFYVEACCSEPDPILSLKGREIRESFYIGQDGDQYGGIIKEQTYYLKTEDDKVAYWENALVGKLIVFRPKVKINGDRYYLNIQIQSIEDNVADGFSPRFLSIPHSVSDGDAFNNRLLEGGFVILKDYPHLNQDPAYIINGDYLYFGFGAWQKHPTQHNAWRASDGLSDIKRVKLSQFLAELESCLVDTTAAISFFNEEAEEMLRPRFEEMGEKLIKRDTGRLSVLEKPGTEFEFLKHFKACTVMESLVYNEKDLLNFHISMKTNALIVLAGMSGTGKTRLAKSYAKTLGITEPDGRLLFMPISPSYLEPSDVLGYLNHTTGRYMPSETGLVDLLVRATRHPEELHMVIFDEMNLSQVEHWFAPLLSLLELKTEERILNLYSSQTPCANQESYPSQVGIGDNILFVGTVNLDETTKEFSDRLLDRVNMVTIQKGSFLEMKRLGRKLYPARTFSFREFDSWRSTRGGIEIFEDAELAFFDSLHSLINQYDSQKGVSYRFLNRLAQYIGNIPEGMDDMHRLTKGEAIDLGIKQGLLTKIKGNRQHVGALIGEIPQPGGQLESSGLFDLLKDKESAQVSDFIHTQKELYRKAQELGIYGYTG
ncbi:MAG: AAA family ATPase [Turicibacter sp.]|nr:AAA family ATPase [Turicibacter sp.]